MTQYTALKKIIEEGDVVFFGGAGVSTESGIPDFRSGDGIYQQRQYGMSAEALVSSDTFWRNQELFYRFYFDKMVYPEAKPNAAHQALARMEKLGLCSAVITQNIDGLHQMAGSKRVLELHGSIHQNTCTKCHQQFTLSDVLKQQPNQPICTRCGGLIKPDVVLYGEALNQRVMEEAVQAIASAKTLIIGGTSLVVYPAAGLIRYFRGKNLVLINKAVTDFDDQADLVIHEPIGEVLGSIL